jgi:beta-N-acetylhexosaminidase
MLLTSLQDWAPSKKLIHDLEFVGIKFDICMNEDRLAQVMDLVHSHPGANYGMLELYQEARLGGEAKVIIALDPVNGNVAGSIILFTRGSSVASYMPWIFEFDHARVGGLCGLVTDPLYANFKDVLTVGLVGCAARQFKLQGFERCVINDVSDYEASLFTENGFKTWRRYLSLSNSAETFRRGAGVL